MLMMSFNLQYIDRKYCSKLSVRCAVFYTKNEQQILKFSKYVVITVIGNWPRIALNNKF